MTHFPEGQPILDAEAHNTERPALWGRVCAVMGGVAALGIVIGGADSTVSDCNKDGENPDDLKNCVQDMGNQRTMNELQLPPREAGYGSLVVAAVNK